MIRLAVIGVGHLGQSHARILAAMPGVQLVGVADTNPMQARMVAEKCGTQAFDDFHDLIGKVDAVTVVVPTIHHHAVARTFLEAGVPTLVEKPISSTREEAQELIHLASAKNLVLQVGHIERFNPAFEALAQLPIRPKFIESHRCGPFTGRSSDIGVVLDLMIHDLDLILSLVHSRVRSVHALGAAVFGGHEDMVNARLEFENGCVAHITASRISPVPKRQLQVWSAEGYACIDFMTKKLALIQPSEELRTHGLRRAMNDPARRDRIKDEIYGEWLQTCERDCTRPTDALTSELRHFVDCVATTSMPRVSGEDGLAALELAEMVLESLRHHAWEGHSYGPHGSRQLPEVMGKLFVDQVREAA